MTKVPQGLGFAAACLHGPARRNPGERGMNVKGMLQDWWRRQTLEDDSPFDNDSFLFFTTFGAPRVIVLILGFIPWDKPKTTEPVLITSTVADEIEPELLRTPQEVY